MQIPWSELKLINPVRNLTFMPSPWSAYFNAPGRKRYNPSYRNPGDARGHGGIDLHDWDKGVAIAPATGRVVSVKRFWTNPAAGYVLVIAVRVTGGWFFLRMLHFDKGGIEVAVGDRVVAGQRVGKVGCTGQCTRPHIHFEVRWSTVPFVKGRDSVRQGVTLDPLAFGLLPGVESRYYGHLIRPDEPPVWPATLRRGDDHPSVAVLAGLLYAIGVMPEFVYGATEFGSRTEGAVEALQRRTGITVDGIFGPESKAALTAELGRGYLPS